MRQIIFIVVLALILLLNNCLESPAYRSSPLPWELTFDLSQIERRIESLQSFQGDIESAVNALNKAVAKIADKQYELEERIFMTEIAAGVVDVNTAGPLPHKTDYDVWLHDIRYIPF